MKSWQWLDLKTKNPALYQQLAKEMTQFTANQTKRLEETNEEEVLDEIDVQVGRDLSRDQDNPLKKDGFEVMQESDRYVTYRDSAGNTIVAPSDDYQRALELAYEYGYGIDDDEDDLDVEPGEEETKDEK